ncbi:hypothetical protein H4582DRAFT_209304 [Lactarius indigo]|nr:hypothetical protein H4582DRAFT_209304 [Lactarius indigo]
MTRCATRLSHHLRLSCVFLVVASRAGGPFSGTVTPKAGRRSVWYREVVSGAPGASLSRPTNHIITLSIPDALDGSVGLGLFTAFLLEFLKLLTRHRFQTRSCRLLVNAPPVLSLSFSLTTKA